jgi:predicted kinase
MVSCTGDAPGPGTTRARVARRIVTETNPNTLVQHRPSAFLVTGISASGKSTVGQLLAEQFPRGVHVRGDAFRRSIVRGREEMTDEPTDEALRQLRLRYHLMASTADTYAEHGFTVVAQDVILGPVLAEVIQMFTTRPLGVVVLAPSPEVVHARERGRAKDGYHSFTPEQLDASLRRETPKVGLWVDSSTQTAVETVAEILARIDPEGLVWD